MTRLVARRNLLSKQLEQPGPAAVDALAHRFAIRHAHALEISMLEFHSCAAGGVGHEPYFHFRRQGDAGIRLPLSADFPAYDEPLRRLPDADMTDHRLGPVLALRVPAAAHERFNDGFPDRRGADVMSLRPPAIEPGGEYSEGSFRRCLHDDGFAHRRNADGSIHGFFPPPGFLGFSTSFLNASRASSQNWSSQRRSSPRPSGSM